LLNAGLQKSKNLSPALIKGRSGLILSLSLSLLHIPLATIINLKDISFSTKNALVQQLSYFQRIFRKMTLKPD